MTSLLLVAVFGIAFPEDSEYLGRLTYRAQMDKRYSWNDYQKDKKGYLKLDEADRKAVAFAARAYSSRPIFNGTPAMRIEQTVPRPSLLPAAPKPPTDWQRPPNYWMPRPNYQPYQPYYGRYPYYAFPYWAH